MTATTANYVMLVLVVIVSVASVLTTFYLQKQKKQQRAMFLETIDRMNLEQAWLRKVAQDVYPYVAQTSVDLFYGEINGQQANFTQRQEISAKVQRQNQVVRSFEETFGIGSTAKAQAAMLSYSPDLSPLDINGPEALDLMAKFQQQLRNEE